MTFFKIINKYFTVCCQTAISESFLNQSNEEASGKNNGFKGDNPSICHIHRGVLAMSVTHIMM